MSNNWIKIFLPPVLALALLAGCGGDGGDEFAGNDADAAFVADMVPHHESAVNMAQIARQRAEHLELKTLATDIIGAQKKEISEMEALRSSLPEADGGSMMMGEEHMGHMGLDAEHMGMKMDPAQLLNAETFDITFIDMMIPHHEGAIEMANLLLEDGENPRLQAMARSIVASQTAELEQMRKWRAEWIKQGSSDGGDQG
ncbi:MAG: DUF305 domain-containing protein [Solirubrobacterales bacterium]